MRKINFPLLLGCIIMLLLTTVSLFPGLFTSSDPLFEEPPKYIQYKENGEWVEKFSMNPMPPNRENILGTDDAGRDVYARLVYGTRNTLKLALLVAVFRMAIALPLGIAAGMGLRVVSGIIRIFNIFFTAIPVLLFSFVVLNIGYFRTLEVDKAIPAFAILLTIVGWAKLAGMIEDSTRRVMEEDFIEGEIAIGKTRLQIALQNVLPHIIPESISLFFKEMGMALFMIAQLAVLYVFVGVARKIKELAFRDNYEMILEPEWGGTLSRIAVNMNRYEAVYWVTIYPVLLFSFAIIGINLTGEGLRIEFQKRESRVISSIRKAYFIISPRVFISQLKDIRKYYKPVTSKILAIAVVVAYILIPWHPSLYKFDIEKARLHLEELSKTEYGERLTGTEGGYLTGEYIISNLKSSGYQVDIMEIPISLQNGSILVKSGWIKLTDRKGEEKTYYLHKDFSIATLSDSVFRDKSTEKLHYRGVAADGNNAALVPEGKEFFLIEPNFYEIEFTDQAYYTPKYIKVGQDRKLSYDIKFLLNTDYEIKDGPNVFNSTSIIPSADLRTELQSGYWEVEIGFDYPVQKYPGRNIIAFLPGRGKTKEEPGELIIIGAAYDSIRAGASSVLKTMTATSAATALEVARVLSLIKEPLEKSVQFIFWDNEYGSPGGSEYYNKKEQIPFKMANSHGYFYFDISYPGYTWDKDLNLMTAPSQIPKKNYYLVGFDMEKRLKQLNIKYRRHYYDYTSTNALGFMRLNALTSVGLGSPSSSGGGSPFIEEQDIPKNTMENINYKKMEGIGQIILDTLTMNSRVMEKETLEKEK